MLEAIDVGSQWPGAGAGFPANESGPLVERVSITGPGRRRRPSLTRLALERALLGGVVEPGRGNVWFVVRTPQRLTKPAGGS